MPNTLCHIGVQLPLNRLIDGKDNLCWVIVACIIPDLPWIVLKSLVALELFNPYDLRLYCTAQASLFFCLFLSAGLACFSRQTGRVFIVLSGNCLLHLLLDALQIKWGNGVHLLAPFNWTMLHLDLTWPEHPVTQAFTFLGFVLLVRYWQTMATLPHQSNRLSPKKTVFGLFFLVCYLVAPILYLDDLNKVDTYYLRTMRHQDRRPGKAIQFDRVHYYADKKTVKTFAGEQLSVIGKQPDRSGRVSFQGYFLTPTTVAATSFHYHRDYRDFASMLGLFMACTLLLHSLLLSHFQARKH